MPWMEASIVCQRVEFVTLACAEGANISRLCRRFGISRKTGYKWLGRFEEGGPDALQDRSRRPHSSPNRTAKWLEEVILEVREAHPAWGARKIRAWLEGAGVTGLPSVSTITAILHRNGRVDPEEADKHRPWQRFEAEAPNSLLQIDFKGHFRLREGRCHPLTVLDDHSRFVLGVYACANERWQTVQGHLTTVFRRYGLPDRMLMDNGSPWGSDEAHPYTPLTAWLIRLGIDVLHSQPYHPQTLGKCERLHRTLKAEAIGERLFRSLEDCQKHFDQWRYVYNFQRPHEALGMLVPASRYAESPREFPESLPPIEYSPGAQVRKVQIGGEIYFHNRTFNVGKAFRGSRVALRPTLSEGVFDVFFCHEEVAQIDLKEHNCST
ncbi:MAG: IS481 family transposase [Chloroflexi bacterium B3_Chlor]|nr:MAG: IS481 family transposase [Chloroflexi bacterium B3_Chlor]